MAVYKYAQFLEQSNNAAFDTAYKPGESTSHSGIYRCEGCGKNEVSEFGKPFPPQNHHQHAPSQGVIRWRLVVATH